MLNYRDDTLLRIELTEYLKYRNNKKVFRRLNLHIVFLVVHHNWHRWCTRTGIKMLNHSVAEKPTAMSIRCIYRPRFSDFVRSTVNCCVCIFLMMPFPPELELAYEGFFYKNRCHAGNKRCSPSNFEEFVSSAFSLHILSCFLESWFIFSLWFRYLLVLFMHVFWIFQALLRFGNLAVRHWILWDEVFV